MDGKEKNRETAAANLKQMLFSDEDEDENSDSSEMDFSDLWDDDVSRKAEKKRVLQEKSVPAKKKHAPKKENDSNSTEDYMRHFTTRT